ncbi:APC family permease [Methanogenium organophilum]|uniref:Amino acid permease n=1 Tax=Methanogenium organophilum TaxID=2199 RepID=A0A9X9S207_METOG|nr:amino acid permease [Methanogenium organophilum]WAI00344.1 amino acid permease [Methanogenium organophilum]
MTELKRTLGIWPAAAVSIGAIIGAGIFVLVGVASGIAGPSVILSFIIAGFVALFTALSAAELSSFITESGGSFIFTHRAFGKFWGFVVGWMQSADYIIGASAVSIGFAGYFLYFIGFSSTQVALIVVGCLLPIILALLNLYGMQEAAGANSILVLLKIIALVLFVVIGGTFILSNGPTGTYQPFFPYGMSGTIHGAAVIFFAFVGFNTVTVIAEEVKDPERTVPRALLIAFLVSTAIYISVSVVAIGLLDWNILATSTAPLETALMQATSNIVILKYVSIAALFATASVVISSIFGGSRAIFAMSRQGILPKRLSVISKKGVPLYSVLLVGFVAAAIILAARGNLDALAQIFNFGTLTTFFFINLSLIKLRWDEPNLQRGFTVPLYPLTPLLGIVSCSLLLIFLSKYAMLFGIVWLAIGVFAFELHTKTLPEQTG